MEEHMQRVVVERAELHDKIEKLTAFLSSAVVKTLSTEERALLQSQLSVMLHYESILDVRLEMANST